MIAFSSGVIIRLRFSGPAMTRRLASSSSMVPIASFLFRAARMAASFRRLARSAPVKPGVWRATTSRSMLSASWFCADADEHRDEGRAAEREVRHLGLAGHRAREERLPGAGRAHQQDAAWHARPELTETAGLFQEGDDFLQLVLGFVDAHYLGKGH